MFFRKKRALPDVQRLDLQRGDRLVVTVPSPLDAEQQQHFREVLEKWAPDGVSVLVLDAGVQLTVLTEPWHAGCGRNPIPQPGS